LSSEQSRDYVVFDLETTGLSPERDAIIEIGAMRVREQGGEYTVLRGETFESLVRPQDAAGRLLPIHWRAQQVHGISASMVAQAPALAQVLPDFLSFVGGAEVVAHNISFDSGFVGVGARRHGLLWAPPQQHCTVQLSRRLFPGERRHKLDDLAARLGLQFSPGGRHRSLGDVEVTAQAFAQLMALRARRLQRSG
jgi:DNA polymerase III subunit epsilon